MKKELPVSALVGTILAVLLLSGCATVKIVASDETIPEGDTAVVYPYSVKEGKADGITLTLKSLDDKPFPKGFHKNSPLRIPAGEHTFTADAKWYSGLTVIMPDPDGDPYRQYFSAKTVHFTYDFQAGVSYYLKLVLGGGEGAEVKLPAFFGTLVGPKRVGGEPFIGQIAVYSVEKYDKQGFPLVTDDTLIEKIGFDPEVSF
jgi:hypothetical protein